MSETRYRQMEINLLLEIPSDVSEDELIDLTVDAISVYQNREIAVPEVTYVPRGLELVR